MSNFVFMSQFSSFMSRHINNTIVFIISNTVKHNHFNNNHTECACLRTAQPPARCTTQQYGAASRPLWQ